MYANKRHLNHKTGQSHDTECIIYTLAMMRSSGGSQAWSRSGIFSRRFTIRTLYAEVIYLQKPRTVLGEVRGIYSKEAMHRKDIGAHTRISWTEKDSQLQPALAPYSVKIVLRWTKLDRWTLTVRVAEGALQLKCKFMIMATGFYAHEEPLRTTIPAIENFKGQVVHPQFSPDNLEYANRKDHVLCSLICPSVDAALWVYTISG